MAKQKSGVKQKPGSERKNAGNGGTIRTFVAIELPEPIRAELEKLQNRIRATGLSAKWSRLENIHLTLKFLGDTAPSDIDKIGEAMGTAASGVSPITLFAKSIGVFPSVRRARVLWTGVGGETDILGGLQQDMAERLSAIGFEKENRRFAGHFTLARFKGPVDAQNLISVTRQFGDFESEAFVADAVHLFESKLTPKGPLYSKLITCALQGVSKET